MTQAQALSILKTGANVFLTGEPGAGKSHTVNQYVQYLREHGIEPAVTASTGIAATHIGGMTVHSWSGIGIKKHLSEEDLDALSGNEKLVRRVSNAHVLIIDEISMLDAETLTAVDAACKALRRRAEPFGGIQVVLVGDFFQLPPVSRQGESAGRFAYKSSAWQEAKLVVAYLSEQHRQEDPLFLRFLSSIRSGRLQDDVHDMLSARDVREDSEMHGVTRLYAHNVDVDRINDQKLAVLETDEKAFDMESHGSEMRVTSLKKGCLSPETLKLKVGAAVMFTKNDFESGFVNGTRGEVVAFADNNHPIVALPSGRRIEVEPAEWAMMDGQRTLARIVQYPLRLSWAITIHKSQGMTLDAAVIDLSEAFEYGQGYVAMSRVKSFSGLHLLGYNNRALQVHPDVIDKDETFRNQSDEAVGVFGVLPQAEQNALEHNFIRACGGSVETVVPKKKAPRSTKTKGMSTHDETLKLWKLGKTISDIAEERDMVAGTIIGHLEELFMRGDILDREISNAIGEDLKHALPDIGEAFRELGAEKLSPVFKRFNERYSYDDLKLARILFYAAERS